MPDIMAPVESSTSPPPAPPLVLDLLDFLNAAWTPYHAVEEAKRRLILCGFQSISEKDTWQGKLLPGGKYLFTRNHSTILAFSIGPSFKPGNPFLVIGAHTDSPCLKVKPCSKVTKAGFLEVGVQTYGGGLWHTWFDRDLSLAGRVVLRGEGGKLEHRLVKIERPILRIPTLAIHLDRDVMEGFKVNRQQHLVPIMATTIKSELEKPAVKAAALSEPSNSKSEEGTAGKSPAAAADEEVRHHPMLLQLLSSQLQCSPCDISDFDLNLCDTQPSVLGGALNEFIFSGRLDNLCSSYCALQALVDSVKEGEGDGGSVCVVSLFDHEECGSDSAQGAGSPVLGEALRRISHSLSPADGDVTSAETVDRALRRSFLVSADMAHALHPNYQDKHEECHQPKFHKGLVIKTNANQRYATDAVSASLFREVARRIGVPCQDFVVRNDSACGSTIGPILASGIGVRTVDVGAPQLSMHSIREVCGVDDVEHAYKHFKGFFKHFVEIDTALAVDD